jgi:hypothetical protein
LAELGVSPKLSSLAQNLEKLPAERFAEVLDGTKTPEKAIREMNRTEKHRARTIDRDWPKGQLKGRDASGDTMKASPEEPPPTLAEQGLTPKLFSLAQHLATSANVERPAGIRVGGCVDASLRSRVIRVLGKF